MNKKDTNKVVIKCRTCKNTNSFFKNRLVYTYYKLKDNKLYEEKTTDFGEDYRFWCAVCSDYKGISEQDQEKLSKLEIKE